MVSFPSPTALNPETLVHLIFHPTQQWKKTSQNKHLYIEHVLPSHSLVSYKQQVDTFLALQNLPTTTIETRQLDGDSMPHQYLVLKVETTEWIQTISPAREDFENKKEALQLCASQIRASQSPFGKRLH